MRKTYAIGISSLNSYTARATDVYVTTPAAEGTVLYRRLPGRFWKEPSGYLHKSIPNQPTVGIQAPFNTAVSIVVYTISSSIIYIFTVGKICPEFNKTCPAIVWVLQEG